MSELLVVAGPGSPLGGLVRVAVDLAQARSLTLTAAWVSPSAADGVVGVRLDRWGGRELGADALDRAARAAFAERLSRTWAVGVPVVPLGAGQGVSVEVVLVSGVAVERVLRVARPRVLLALDRTAAPPGRAVLLVTGGGADAARRAAQAADIEVGAVLVVASDRAQARDLSLETEGPLWWCRPDQVTAVLAEAAPGATVVLDGRAPDARAWAVVLGESAGAVVQVWPDEGLSVDR